MKTSELKRRLKAAGCRLKRHGKKHDQWENPITGDTDYVPRHDSHEIPTGTAEKILGKLLG